jgi:cytochrome c biogenesis protein CcdA
MVEGARSSLQIGGGTDLILSMLSLGFLMGMRHALEADHVAAVASIVSRRQGIRAISRHGVFWGFGHTLTLFLVGGTVILLKGSIDDRLATALEFAVGITVTVLGVSVLWCLFRDKVHFHAHRHNDGEIHLHAHSHRGDPFSHEQSLHDHTHSEGIPWRSLLVGLMHGMAGSAALVVLTAAALDSPLWGLAYILLFGLGSIVGMAALSAVIALPLTYTARSLTRANRALQLIIGIATIAIGLSLLKQAGSLLFLA